MRVRWFLLMVLMGLSTVAQTAHADDIGPVGAVMSVQLNASTSDEFVQYHGRLILLSEDGARTLEYLWGGARCPGRNLSEAQVAILFDLAAAPYMRLEPRTKNGTAGAKCLVGFTTFNRKYE